jgi:hypothetical protein
LRQPVYDFTLLRGNREAVGSYAVKVGEEANQFAERKFTGDYRWVHRVGFSTPTPL